MGFVALQGGGLRTRTKRVVWTCSVQETPKLRENLTKWGLNINYRAPFERVRLLHEDPPIFEIPDFLSDHRCRVLQQYARTERAAKSDAVESDLYLNYRVNAEVAGEAASSEAQALLAEQKISEDELKASQKSGFRLKVEDVLVRPFLVELQELMGLEDRTVRFEEGIWHKPNRLNMMIRDQTIVHYEKDEGVAPHVDGKDATLLCYLNDVEEGAGGHTVFPEIGLSVAPRKGTALLYESKEGLLHYSQAVTRGEKWIMQLLIDFRYDPSLPTVDWETGQVID